MRTSAASTCSAASAWRRTTPSVRSARPAGPPARTCTTSSASPARRATRTRSRCRPRCRSRSRTFRPSATTPSRSSRGSISSPTASSRSSSRNEKGPCGPFLLFSWLRLSGERRPAAAGALRVRILDHELRAFQAFLVVDLGADQVLVAHRIDEQGDAVLLHRGVVLVLHLVEGEAVLEARAAAAGDEYTELELRIAFLVDQLLDLVGGAVGEDQRRRHLGNGIHLLLSSLSLCRRQA